MFRLSSMSQIAKSTSPPVVCAALIVVLCLLPGCGVGPQAEFKYRDSTNKLIGDAQKAMTKTLQEGFGTPHELVAWEKFPIGYGGAKGTVSGKPAADSASSQLLTVTFEGEATNTMVGAPLLWLTGARASQTSVADTVAHFDPKTNQLKWSGMSLPAPVSGDKFVIGFGEHLKQGRAVYMKNCMHCHGVSGDGAGPTADYLSPRPRDYRLGVFKFTSTLAAEKISRDDLHRILKHGIPGTYMPSFLLLGEKETRSVIEYVRWLAVRGEFEKRTDDDLAEFSVDALEDTVKKAAATYDAAKKAGETPAKGMTLGQAMKEARESFAKFQSDELAGAIEDTATFLADAWTRADADESVILPTVSRVVDEATSRERGRLLFMSDKTKCYTCHGMLGKGDGLATEDFWKKPGSELMYSRRGLHDAWGNPLRPRNLTLGQYRGGRRPVDLFRRIYAGIKGTPMPGFGKTALKDEEIWDVVNFVMSLQFQSTQPPNTGSGQMAAAETKHSK